MLSALEHHRLDLPEMDEQHNYLYTLFGLLGKTEFTASHENTVELLGEIERYLLFHFASEEHLMRMYGFPYFAMHQGDHESAARKFIEFLDAFENGHFNPSSLRIFLTGWLLEHSASADMEYTTFIKQKRVRFVSEM